MDPIEQACEALGVVGSRFREELSLQVRAAVLARGGREPLRVTGATGTGKALAVGVVHRVAAEALGRPGALVEVDSGELTDDRFEVTLFGQDGLLERARGGTLVFQDAPQLSPNAQGRLLRLLGAREYRPVGSPELRRADALLVLASNRDLLELANEGRFRRELLDRAPAKLTLTPLWQRREDIGELAQHFTREALAERDQQRCLGLTRRALADVEGAFVEAKEGSVRRLRELVRDVVFSLGEAPEAIESETVGAFLLQSFGQAPTEAVRAEADRDDLQERFELVVEAAALRELAELHGLPEAALLRLARALRELKESFQTDGRGLPPSYRNLMSRTQLATKAALWVLSGAKNQAEFRRWFGARTHEMPPKSVAWQIFHDLYGDAAAKPTEDA